MSRTHIIQNTIPTRYDPRVTVMPCEPARVPRLPVEILYQIAKALPQPKQVYNLALASKETWEYLEPALYECEVTYEARLSDNYGGESSTSLKSYSEDYAFHTFSDVASSEDDGSWDDSEDDFQSDDNDRSGEDSAAEALRSHQENMSAYQRASILDPCYECDTRISLEDRIFEAPMPEKDDPILIDGAMTALHWAAKQGASALPVAQKAIRSALAHHPSYINGLELQERRLRDPGNDNKLARYVPADLPPPLFLAVAHGNFEVFKALLDAGCAVNVWQGQVVCGHRFPRRWRRESMMSFKIHEECMPGGLASCICEGEEHSWVDLEDTRNCQTVGHIAVRYEQPDMLKALLQSGLNIHPPQPKSLHLAQFAVRKASVAALQVLLDQDPSLAHGDLHHGTLLHSLRFIGRNADRSLRDRLMRSTISCLLEHGAILDTRADEEVDWSESDDESETNEGALGELTALQAALPFDGDTVGMRDPQIITALHAAEVLISMGANWNQRIRPDISSSILHYCLLLTVIKTRTEMWCDTNPYPGYEFKRNPVDIRTAWGRVFKTIIQTACEPSTRDKPQNKEAFESIFLAKFGDLVEIWSRSDTSGGSCCPLAARAMGRLLLSAGITPSDADLQKWRTLCSGEDIRG